MPKFLRLVLLFLQENTLRHWRMVGSFLIFLSLFNISPVQASNYSLDLNPPMSVVISPKIMDQRAVILQAYLAKYNSPLKNHAVDFVESADLYNLDWKLVAAIAGVESTFGKFVPGGTEKNYTSYNAWGWGVYGTQAIYFKSWQDGIYTVSKGLRKGYFDKGLTDPYNINRVYAASPTWGTKVHYFLTDIEKFEKQYNNKISLLDINSLNTKSAGSSGTLAFSLTKYPN